jgi:hypothetical protein
VYGTLDLIVLVAGVAFLSIIGIVATIWPEKVQSYALRYYERHTLQARLNVFLPWMRTHSYVMVVRLCGLVALGMLVVILGLFSGWW